MSRLFEHCFSKILTAFQTSKYRNHNATKPQGAEIVVNGARVLLKIVEVVSIVIEVEKTEDSVLRHLDLVPNMAGEGADLDRHNLAGGQRLHPVIMMMTALCRDVPHKTFQTSRSLPKTAQTGMLAHP